AGIGLVDLDTDRVLDLAFDGADEVDPALRLLKGGGGALPRAKLGLGVAPPRPLPTAGGGALLREKLVLAAAGHAVIVAESPKLVDRLGATRPLPVEVVRFAWPTTRRRLPDRVPSDTLRRTPHAPPC